MSVRIWRPGEPLEGLAGAVAAGRVIAIPTESSYGLAVDPRDGDAVGRLFAFKRRAGRLPFPVVIGERAQLSLLPVDPAAPIMAQFGHLWPAPLSLVVPLRRPLPAALGESTAAIRIPDHALLRELLCALGVPLTATSANRAGEPPALSVEEAAALLAELDEAWVVDGGTLPGGLPSTLVAMVGSEVRMVRQGRFPIARLVPAGQGESPA
ncbi:MAG TPA: L-threonylcarbamoyladenylate synthase [Thermoanaerobaculia bacterium]|jgi:tRNA threonylcarbamoyl adenosine modification protein (Sua5/YciO/YrdC/YwlC family)|nr:MAG: Threonylcarbamoyl-AMP synthase [Acidobacteria bacterium ADurb.Bin051]HNU82916.1 L-threonylcarbamoyladenylate synthase [Thermoanaerobaculia bacterium]HQN40177.1 L-threonylcarbamoyladenylate synthase [Thermoanaerobaculia bacterium]